MVVFAQRRGEGAPKKRESAPTRVKSAHQRLLPAPTGQKTAQSKHAFAQSGTTAALS